MLHEWKLCDWPNFVTKSTSSCTRGATTSKVKAENMDPVNVIRAPSLKRGKPDERLTERVSIEVFLFKPQIEFCVVISQYVNTVFLASCTNTQKKINEI